MPLPVPPPPLLAPTFALVERLRKARHIVVLTGAGMSAESGIATFRDEEEGGLSSQFDPLALATPEAFERDPDTVWAWYEWRRQRVARAVPMPATRR
jgi:NAD-dependent deacetylase